MSRDLSSVSLFSLLDHVLPFLKFEKGNLLQKIYPIARSGEMDAHIAHIYGVALIGTVFDISMA